MANWCKLFFVLLTS